MKKTILIAALSAFYLSGCGNGSQEQAEKKTVAVSEPVVKASEPAEVDHYYSMKDGFEYGYQKEVSDKDKDAGIATLPLLMVSYAGQRNGKYQVFMHAGPNYQVVQCENPCEFLKIMVFNEYLKKPIDTQRMQAVDGILGVTMIKDAINGKLEVFAPVKDGKTYHVWFDEKTGFESKVYTTQ